MLTPSEATPRIVQGAAGIRLPGGNAVVFISHKLDEVLEISDRITVLRGGRKVATEEDQQLHITRCLAKLMVGHEIVLNDLRGRIASAASLSPKAVMSLP